VCGYFSDDISSHLVRATDERVARSYRSLHPHEMCADTMDALSTELISGTVVKAVEGMEC